MVGKRTGETPLRAIRVPTGVWQRAQDRARQEGRSLTEVITTYLHRYGQGQPRPPRK